MFNSQKQTLQNTGDVCLSRVYVCSPRIPRPRHKRKNYAASHGSGKAQGHTEFQLSC